MTRGPITTLGRTLAITACLAVAACSAAPGAIPSGPAPRPSAVLSSTAPPFLAVTAVPSATATPTMPTASPPASSSPLPTPPSTPAALVPAKPTGVTFTTEVVELPGPAGTDEMTYQATHTVRWTAPLDDGVEIRVYGVTECLSEPTDPSPGTSGPCLVEHTRLPSSVMALAASAPAAAGEISWLAPIYYECAGPPVGRDGLDYQAIVIAAYNAAGHSIFAIAEPGSWLRAAPGDVIC